MSNEEKFDKLVALIEEEKGNFLKILEELLTPHYLREKYAVEIEITRDNIKTLNYLLHQAKKF